MRLRGLVAGLAVLALAAPADAMAFNPSDEFKLKDWVPIHLGGLDLSITRAVVYLLEIVKLANPFIRRRVEEGGDEEARQTA